MKITIDLPDALIHEVRLRADVQKRTVNDLVAEFIRQGLGMPPRRRTEKHPASAKVEVGENGLPVIRCAQDAPATRMSAEELLALEQETQRREDSQRAGLFL